VFALVALRQKQEWSHTRSLVFRGQSNNGVIATLAQLALQRQSVAAAAAKAWADCAEKLRQIRKKVCCVVCGVCACVCVLAVCAYVRACVRVWVWVRACMRACVYCASLPSCARARVFIEECRRVVLATVIDNAAGVAACAPNVDGGSRGVCGWWGGVEGGRGGGGCCGGRTLPLQCSAVLWRRPQCTTSPHSAGVPFHCSMLRKLLLLLCTP
jgi:hypothetical protein